MRSVCFAVALGIFVLRNAGVLSSEDCIFRFGRILDEFEEEVLVRKAEGGRELICECLSRSCVDQIELRTDQSPQLHVPGKTLKKWAANHSTRRFYVRFDSPIRKAICECGKKVSEMITLDHPKSVFCDISDCTQACKGIASDGEQWPCVKDLEEGGSSCSLEDFDTGEAPGCARFDQIPLPSVICSKHPGSGGRFLVEKDECTAGMKQASEGWILARHNQDVCDGQNGVHGWLGVHLRVREGENEVKTAVKLGRTVLLETNVELRLQKATGITYVGDPCDALIETYCELQSKSEPKRMRLEGSCSTGWTLGLHELTEWRHRVSCSIGFVNPSNPSKRRHSGRAQDVDAAFVYFYVVAAKVVLGSSIPATEGFACRWPAWVQNRNETPALTENSADCILPSKEQFGSVCYPQFSSLRVQSSTKLLKIQKGQFKSSQENRPRSAGGKSDGSAATGLGMGIFVAICVVAGVVAICLGVAVTMIATTVVRKRKLKQETEEAEPETNPEDTKEASKPNAEAPVEDAAGAVHQAPKTSAESETSSESDESERQRRHRRRRRQKSRNRKRRERQYYGIPTYTQPAAHAHVAPPHPISASAYPCMAHSCHYPQVPQPVLPSQFHAPPELPAYQISLVPAPRQTQTPFLPQRPPPPPTPLSQPYPCACAPTGLNTEVMERRVEIENMEPVSHWVDSPPLQQNVRCQDGATVVSKERY